MLRTQLGNPEFTALSFGDHLGLLVDAEWTQREQSASSGAACAKPTSAG